MEAKPTFKYLITLAMSGGLTELLIRQIREYLAARFTQVVMNTEPHKSGLLHLHAFAYSEVASSSAIRKHMQRFLIAHDVVVGPKTLNVKVADDNAANYVIKEVSDEKPVTLCQGWQIKDLLQKRLEAVKKLSKVSAQGSDKVVTQDEAVPLIIRYAKTANMTLTDKASFKDVIKEMVRMGFSFSHIRMNSTYAEVMCRCGDDRALDDLLDMQLICLT